MCPYTSNSGIAIVGGGPAGLMAAEVLVAAGYRVAVFDAMPSLGRKFLMAGKGGMNITHSEDQGLFLSRYGAESGQLLPYLESFSATRLREWVHGLGFPTFVGSSGRVFPEGMKAAPLLRAWLHRLREAGVVFHVRHRWRGWQDGLLCFDTPNGELTLKPRAVVFALGGGSWPQLGSDGGWVDLLRQRCVEVADLKPANCGFDVAWSAHFRSRFAGKPVKSVLGFTRGKPIGGDFNITETGVEGGLIYALSRDLREQWEAGGYACLQLDLAPGRSLERLEKELARPRGRDSMANHLRRRVGIDGVKAGLLREYLSADTFDDARQLAGAIKALPIPIGSPRPLAEAISSAGGVCFASLDENLMLRQLPGVFCAGEMLDWEAPTGGYLLTACFATGRAAGEGAVRWLRELSE